MNLRVGAVYVILLALAAAVFAEERVHIVAEGETVYRIARTYGVSEDELMRYNGITDPLRLVAGRRLKIPGTSSAPVPGGSGPVSPFTEYRAVQGDTLYDIARRNGVTLQSLLNANGFSIRYVLKEGDVLKIPQSQAAVAAMPVSPAVPPVERAPVADPRSTASRAVDPSVRWPVAAKEITYMTGKLSGVVLVGEQSESVRSLTQGTVVSAGPYRGFGRVAIVQVTGGYLYVYGGCESLSVKEGDRVTAGTELGRLGLDVVSEKPQLFFMVYQSNIPVDPAKAPRA